MNGGGFRLHPLHPLAVHAPIACILFTPLADAAALLSGSAELWRLGALAAAGALVFGLIAALFGALDFDRAYAKAPRTVLWHAGLMVGAATCAGVGLAGRLGDAFVIAAPPPWWAIGAGLAAFLAMAAGAFLGGELVYVHGVGVDTRAEER